MKKKGLMGNLLDFFREHNQFEVCQEYRGMAASQRNDFFGEYFQKLSPKLKREMGRIIVMGATGREKKLQPYLARTLSLLSYLCLRGYREYFRDELNLLEKEVVNPQNLQLWINSEDKEIIPTNLDFKKDWHYGLWLCNVLDQLGSAQFSEIASYLSQNANSNEFRRILVERLQDSHSRQN